MSLVLVALAVALRLAWVLLVPTRPVGDFALYLESAAHLVEHHALDAEFIYMPGYVFLLAGVQALGGGLLAAKLIGVAAGGLGTWSVFEIAQRLWSRTTALVAALLFAVWPAGIAVASVTGTDMPAGALLAAAVAVLLRGDARPHPWRAAVGFGVVLGLAAYVRAVAVPLAVLAFAYWLATAPAPRGATAVKRALARTALGCGVAFLVLLPWGIRNQRRYGELFLTDSHGGHTALVGANPNSDGVYSRSLNQMFWKGTGYRLFDPAPRDADRAAYALARSWAAFEPRYAIGLVAAKADRLLSHERPLLYWPLYRASVLREPPRAFFDRHRAAIENLVDGFWYLLAAAATAGLALAAARRQARALSILLFPLALVALYATFFSEVRYHLAIAIFMFPFAAEALCWLVTAARGLAARRVPDRREGLSVALAVALLLLGWPALVRAGDGLRDRHRWAVCVCQVGPGTRLCNWRAEPATDRQASGRATSPLRGVWDGVGLRVTGDGTGAAASSDVTVPPGRYRVTARADRGLSPGPGPAHITVQGDGQIVGAADWPDARVDARPQGGQEARQEARPEARPEERRLEGTVDHPGGPLRLALRAWSLPSTPEAPGGPPTVTIWISDIRVEPVER